MPLELPALAQESTPAEKPNILVIMADDIGYWNISAYSRGLMGFTTPNIDRIGNEGGVFVNYYGQQSCTAGRAAFVLGQSPFRTGLTKVGLPGPPCNSAGHSSSRRPRLHSRCGRCSAW